ncbi:MAG: HAMP domain-containing protein [Candidatus Cloacimonetes bacterium]|nr:HAMP domain-containing protein [Candidatus Cloacimonadota bacterium]
MKLFSKLFWSFLTVFLLFAIIFYIFTYKNVNSNYLDASRHYLEEYGNIIQAGIISFVHSGDYEGLDRYIHGLNTQIRITYIDLDGKVRADSDKDKKTLENHADRPEIISAWENGTGFAWRFSTSVNHKMLYFAERIMVEDVTAGFLRLSFYDYQIEELQKSLSQDMTKYLIIGVMISLILTYFISRSFIKPIQMLASATKKLSAGDFSVRLNPSSKDELYDLSLSFNIMTDKIDKLVQEISAQKESLRNIIDNINELLWVIDTHTEKITMANKAFSRFLGIEDPTNKHFWEIFRNMEINQLIKDAISDRKAVIKEVNIREHICHMSIYFHQENGSMIILLHDISPLRQLEKVKRDFVINASHELRTPLASIKGYTELLKRNVSPENENILEAIERNNQRLTFIVNDILSLASLEDISSLDREKANVSTLLDNAANIFKTRLEAKNLKLKKNYLPNVYALIDIFRFEQIVNNLIDNALKYTSQGSITLSLVIENKNLVFECKDTGIGIPENSLSRIFERFFVINKSHSRKSGGTGLGLSIVKHVVQLYGGEISVKSVLNSGSSFKISIPLEP